MAKQILKLVEKITQDAKDLDIAIPDLTASIHVYHHAKTGVLSGHLRLPLTDLLEAIDVINRKINKVSKLEKRLDKLEKKK